MSPRVLIWTALYCIQKLIAPKAYARGVQREQERAEQFFKSLR